MPHVAAITKLTDVLPSVLAADVNVRALHGPLEQRPVTFEAVHMMDTAHVFFF